MTTRKETQQEARETRRIKAVEEQREKAVCMMSVKNGYHNSVHRTQNEMFLNKILP